MTPLLTEIEASGASGGVLLIGATNLLERVDPAVTRPGRFDKLVAVDSPDFAAREAIWRKRLGKHPCADDIDVRTLADLSDGLSGADIAEVARTAAESVWMQCVRDGIDRSIEMLDVLVSLRRGFADGATKRRIDELMTDDWREKLG